MLKWSRCTPIMICQDKFHTKSHPVQHAPQRASTSSAENPHGVPQQEFKLQGAHLFRVTAVLALMRMRHQCKEQPASSMRGCWSIHIFKVCQGKADTSAPDASQKEDHQCGRTGLSTQNSFLHCLESLHSFRLRSGIEWFPQGPRPAAGRLQRRWPGFASSVVLSCSVQNGRRPLGDVCITVGPVCSRYLRSMSAMFE